MTRPIQSLTLAQGERLAKVMGHTVRAPKMRQRLFAQGLAGVGSGPEGLARRIASDTQVLDSIIREPGIQAAG